MNRHINSSVRHNDEINSNGNMDNTDNNNHETSHDTNAIYK